MSSRFPWEPFPTEEASPRGPDPVPRRAVQAAVTAADAYRSLRAALGREDGVLRVGNRFVPDRRYRQVAFVAVGSAANSMALAALHAIGDRLTQGYVAGPEPVADEIPFRGEIVPPGLPGFPGAEGIVRAAEEIAEGLGPDDLLLYLVSPGALRALAVPPPGATPAEFEAGFRAAVDAGATGRDVALLARTVGTGGVGGRLGAAATRGDCATFVLDRGDGPGLVGGGPVDPVRPAERTEVREIVARLGAARLGPLAAGADLPGATPSPARPASVARPVVIAAPSDALRAAAESIFDRGWTSRIGFLQLRAPPDEAAERLVARAEELVDAEGPPGPESRGVAVVAMTTLGLPEGVDEGPALAAFLTRARAVVRRREMSVTIARTAGGIGDAAYPPVAVVGPPSEPRSTVPPDPPRGYPLPAGITDVGLLAIVLSAPSPAPAGAAASSRGRTVTPGPTAGRLRNAA